MEPLEQVLKFYKDNVKIVFKHFPLKMHEHALSAAAASLYADTQGKFPEFHRELGKHYQTLDEEKILDVAENIGLDRAIVASQFQNPAWLKKIQKDITDGKRAGVKGIPKVFINGRPLNKRNFPGFRVIIDDELRKKKEK